MARVQFWILRNVEYFFINITPRSTLTQSGSKKKSNDVPPQNSKYQLLFSKLSLDVEQGQTYGIPSENWTH